ncbi:MAG: hypothetical protein OCU12_05975 [Methanophagales archaeon]|nr:hypothetical protein [Methanophagales archaeon]
MADEQAAREGTVTPQRQAEIDRTMDEVLAKLKWIQQDLKQKMFQSMVLAKLPDGCSPEGLPVIPAAFLPDAEEDLLEWATQYVDWAYGKSVRPGWWRDDWRKMNNEERR